MFQMPVPFSVFACEGVEWLGDGSEALDKSAIEIAKTQKRTDVVPDAVFYRL